MGTAQIYGYNHKYLKGILTTGPCSKATSPGSPLVPFLAMDFDYVYSTRYEILQVEQGSNATKSPMLLVVPHKQPWHYCASGIFCLLGWYYSMQGPSLGKNIDFSFLLQQSA